MKRDRKGTVKLIVGFSGALLVAACSDPPTTTQRLTPTNAPSRQVGDTSGTGLVLHSLTGLQLPLIGSLGDVVIDQVNLTHLVLVQDILGNIIGLKAEGVIKLTGGVLGTDVITEDFLTQVHVVSSGTGQCDVLTVDLGPITLDALGTGVSVDVPQADVTPSASGALGPLLCSLGQALQPGVHVLTSVVRSLVDAINALLI
jgi:hypothetical protein